MSALSKSISNIRQQVKTQGMCKLTGKANTVFTLLRLAAETEEYPELPKEEIEQEVRAWHQN